MRPTRFKYGKIRNCDYRLGIQVQRCYMWDEPVGWVITFGLAFWVFTFGPEGYV